MFEEEEEVQVEITPPVVPGRESSRMCGIGMLLGKYEGGDWQVTDTMKIRCRWMVSDG